MSDHDAPPRLAPLPLEYGRPQPSSVWDDNALPLRIARRLVFALGLGLLATGIVQAWAGVDMRDAPYFAGWGAGLIGLTLPLWRRRDASR